MASRTLAALRNAAFAFHPLKARGLPMTGALATAAVVGNAVMSVKTGGVVDYGVFHHLASMSTVQQMTIDPAATVAAGRVALRGAAGAAAPQLTWDSRHPIRALVRAVIPGGKK